jgi:hypothetical protein
LIARRFIVFFGVLAIIGGAVRAADGELDMDFMQTIEDTNKSLASNIALQDAKGSTSDAQELHTLFGTVEKHFVAKGDAQDAVDLTRQSLQLTQSIVQQVAQKDFGKAQDSATALSRTCRSCHTFYKKS